MMLTSPIWKILLLSIELAWLPHGTIIPPVIPAIATYPVISGTATVGQTLNVTTGTWAHSPTLPYTYQWQSEGSNATGTGATTNAYTLAAADFGHLVTCNVVAANGVGSSLPARSNLYGPAISTTAFYVSSSSGNDSWNGTAPAFVSGTTGPWATLAHVNAQTLAAGASVLFKRGDKWDRSGGPTVTGSIFPNNGGSSGNPIVYDAYGTGANPIIDGSADASTTGAWANVGTNLWRSVQVFAPTGGLQGRPYFNANDVGNILWNFAPLGGTAPAAVKSASFGKMTGGGAGGVWYKPSDGTLNLGSTQGNWNFNTDLNKVQIYSVGNPATAMPGLRLVLDGAGVLTNSGTQWITFQNLTFQNLGASGAVFRDSHTTLRDCVFQWVGGGNNGGASGSQTRYGDGVNPEDTYDTILIERNYFYQIYDNDISPQQFTTGSHDNLTVRNNIFDHFDKAIELEPTPLSSSTMNGVYIYNNTSYGVNSWSANQRPNGGAATWAFEMFPGNPVTIAMSNLDMRNDVFAGIQLFGIFLHLPLNDDMSDWTTPKWDYNAWRLASGTGINIGNSHNPPANIAMSLWVTQPPQWDSHGLIDVNPLFTTAGSDYTPTSGSPLRNAGVNLSSVGVVWDFFRKPRPASGAFTMGAIQ